MCIKKDHEHLEKSTCCCGCSLFTATMMIGVLEFFSVIGSALHRNYLGMGLSLAQCVFFILVAVKKTSLTYRKWLYYLYLAMTICFTVIFAAGILALAFSEMAYP